MHTQLLIKKHLSKIIYLFSSISVFVFYFKDKIDLQLYSNKIPITHLFLSIVFLLLLINIFINITKYTKVELGFLFFSTTFILARLFFDEYTIRGQLDTFRFVFFLTLIFFLLHNEINVSFRLKKFCFSIINVFIVVHLVAVLANLIFELKYGFDIFWGLYESKQYLGLTFLFLIPLIISFYDEKLLLEANLFYSILLLAIFFVLISFDRKSILSLFLLVSILYYFTSEKIYLFSSLITLFFIAILFFGVINNQYALRFYNEFINQGSFGSGRWDIYGIAVEKMRDMNILEILFGAGIGKDIEIGYEVWNLELNSHIGIINVFLNYGIFIFLCILGLTIDLIFRFPKNKVLRTFLIVFIISQLYSISLLYSSYLPLIIPLMVKKDK